jgi:hypothetical protein
MKRLLLVSLAVLALAGCGDSADDVNSRVLEFQDLPEELQRQLCYESEITALKLSAEYESFPIEEFRRQSKELCW